MRYFASLNESNVVVSTLACDGVPGEGGVLPDHMVEVSQEMLRAIEAAPGSTYVDGVATPPAPRAKVVSKVEFFLLFTAEQRTAIRQFRRDEGNESLEDFYWLLEQAGSVDLGHPMLTGGLQLLVALELITAEDAERITAGQPPS